MDSDSLCNGNDLFYSFIYFTLVCGKLSSKPRNLAQTHWPWHAAIYHRLSDHTSPFTGTTRRHRDMFSADDYDYWQEESMEETWHLVCSGALVSQHAVLVPAHCATEPGHTLPYNTAHLKVVLGENKRLQYMKVESRTLILESNLIQEH